jgi:ribosomal protein S18 acetylase RimI-like enzyme
MPFTYTNTVGSLTADQLTGFFVGWPKHPGPEAHLAILQKSHAAWVALDNNRCVGFVNALSDGIFYSYIPLLEVLPEYQGKGIGTELIRRMMETLDAMYAIDIVCDESVAPFYLNKGFARCVGIIKRNYANQGAENKPRRC